MNRRRPQTEIIIHFCEMCSLQLYCFGKYVNVDGCKVRKKETICNFILDWDT